MNVHSWSHYLGLSDRPERDATAFEPCGKQLPIFCERQASRPARESNSATGIRSTRLSDIDEKDGWIAVRDSDESSILTEGKRLNSTAAMGRAVPEHRSACACTEGRPQHGTVSCRPHGPFALRIDPGQLDLGCRHRNVR